MIGEALAIGSAAASLFGTLRSAKANKLQDKALQNRQSELQSWYDKEYYTPYLDTAAAKGTLSILRNNNKAAMQKVEQGSVIGRKSDEYRAATASALQSDYSSRVTGLAAQGTQRQDSTSYRHQALKANLDNLQAANLQQKSQNWDNFAGNAMNAGIGFAQAAGDGAFDKADKKVTGFLGSIFKSGTGKNFAANPYNPGNYENLNPFEPGDYINRGN